LRGIFFPSSDYFSVILSVLFAAQLHVCRCPHSCCFIHFV